MDTVAAIAAAETGEPNWDHGNSSSTAHRSPLLAMPTALPLRSPNNALLAITEKLFEP